MPDIPYRLWSDRAEETPPAARLIIAKLKPTTAHAERVAFGVRAAATDRRESRLERLIANARVRSVKPIFPLTAADMAEGVSGDERARGRAAGVSRARGLVTIEVARDENPRQLARHLASLADEIEYAYVPPPRRMFAKRSGATRGRAAAPDPFLSRQWGHNAVRIAQARTAAGFKDAADIVVAVADSGIDKTHPDLRGVIREAKNFLKGEPARDIAGHGTHVTGIIAAAINNGIGVSGLCAARILSLKVLPTRVEWDAPAYYRALGYCIGRARVLNLSLGNEESDPGEKDVIGDLIDAGIVVVASMGNEFERGNATEYPAALEGVCAVGATDQADRRAGFSNTGKHISLCAPGVSIFSTTPTYTYKNGATEYDSWDGTSMAAPYVSAAAALMLEKDPTLSPAQVIRKLQQKAVRVPGMKKRPDMNCGWGRLDIAAALR